MDFVPDDETGGFTVTWAIENFSYCIQKKGEHLLSPCYKLNLPDRIESCLGISPRGYETDDRIELFLLLCFPQNTTLKVRKYFSIRTINGTFERRKSERPSPCFEKKYGLVDTCFFTRDELFKKGEDAFLENDTLTLRCRIWKKYPDVSVPGKCFVRTVINVKRISFTWSFENFKDLLHDGIETMEFHAASSETQMFIISFYASTENYEKKNVLVEINPKLNFPYLKIFLTWKLSLLDADGGSAHSVYDEYWYEKGQGIWPYESLQERFKWVFPFMSLKKVLHSEKLYLVNGALSLRCEFAVSYGVKYNEVERTEYGVAEELDKPCCSKTVDSSFQGSLKDNFQRFYNEGRFSDVTIRTASNKEFPVHKAILCARSEVFSAMFEHDTKERRTGVVEIADLNDDIVSKLLLFIYSGIVENLECDTASELYFAADKYGIVALKRECSAFLNGNLNSSNVCEVLAFADMHRDEDMKLAARDFIRDHAAEIINSENWKKVMTEKTYLAAETLQMLFMKNLNI